MTDAAKKDWRVPVEKGLREAVKASKNTGSLTGELKKTILLEAAREIDRCSKEIVRQNARDVAAARKEGLAEPMIERLTLDAERVSRIAEGVRTVAGLDDPIGRIAENWSRPNGLKISKMIVPIGLIFIIYESRPNVTAECASLCLKSGNAVLLRGGRESFYSNTTLVRLFQGVLKRHGLSPSLVSLVPTTDRRAVDFLLRRDDSIQLVIPRGGVQLIRKVVRTSRIPVIKHYQGICHVYVDRAADLEKAARITLNAKLQRPSVCNAMETLLVHRDVAEAVLKRVGPSLKEKGCEIRGDAAVKKILPWVRRAVPSDFGKEFLDKILAVKVVGGMEEAMAHIGRFGSQHTDAIVTEDREAAKTFLHRVDSSSVMVNASTRFSDGFEYGFGAEIGISTDKIHARGPMGLAGLTSYKYVVEGDGHIRQ